MSRADSPEQGRGKIAHRQLSFTQALWPAGADIYARALGLTGQELKQKPIITPQGGILGRATCTSGKRAEGAEGGKKGVPT